MLISLMNVQEIELLRAINLSVGRQFKYFSIMGKSSAMNFWKKVV